MKKDQMKLFRVSGLIPMNYDSAVHYATVDEFIIAVDEDTAIDKYEDIHASCLKAEEGFTKCTFICHRDSIVPTVEPIREEID